MALEPVVTSSLSEHESSVARPRRGAEAVERQPPPRREVQAESTADPEPEPELGLQDDARAEMDRKRAEAADPGLKYREAPKERHRAKSQQASAEDVPTIKALTAELRESEEALTKLRPSEGKNSPREVALRQRIRGVKAELEDLKPKPAAVTREPEPRPKTDTAFTEAEPDYKTFAAEPDKYPDPYLAYNRAVAAWDRRKDAFDAKQAEDKTAVEREGAAVVERRKQAYLTRARAFQSTHPDYESTVKAIQAKGHDIPPIVTRIVLEDDNGPELMYALAQHPDELDELMLQFGQTVPDDRNLVAMRRRLSKLTLDAAGPTGAAREPQKRSVPKPPTPVRTGPLKASDAPLDDGASLSDHEARFPTRRKR